MLLNCRRTNASVGIVVCGLMVGNINSLCFFMVDVFFGSSIVCKTLSRTVFRLYSSIRPLNWALLELIELVEDAACCFSLPKKV